MLIILSKKSLISTSQIRSHVDGFGDVVCMMVVNFICMCFTAPSIPRSFIVTVLTSSSIRISWETPSMPNGVLFYTLYYSIEGVEDSSIVSYNEEMVKIHHSL